MLDVRFQLAVFVSKLLAEHAAGQGPSQDPFPNLVEASGGISQAIAYPFKGEAADILTAKAIPAQDRGQGQ